MQWEYRWFEYSYPKQDEIGKALNALGTEGWELVAIAHDATSSPYLTFYLKRPKSN